MKTQIELQKFRNSLAPLALAALMTTGVSTQAQTPITEGHVDIGIAYEDGSWDLHVHDEENDIEYEPVDAVLVVGPAGQATVPAGSQWSFLGTTGSAYWQLPDSDTPGLPFLGIGAEEIGGGVFVDDLITLTLTGWSGPGNFSLFTVDEFGDLATLWMGTHDGISAADAIQVLAGGHSHYVWAFTQPGDYTLTFEASGTLVAGNTFTSSGGVDYQFQVIPEPGIATLLGLGVACVAFLRRR
ncbi:MAG TPA: choice-of-anchor M domain-containing protein [Verrucomicrobiota bacterium]|nr:choice-of-anchor M domain-containing protein [Verrucomicrobiota bacterium]